MLGRQSERAGRRRYGRLPYDGNDVRCSAITQGIDTTGALRTDATELARYFETIRPLLDIDGNSEFSPLTDGLLVIRYLLGQRGTALVTGAVGAGATRDGAQIEAYLAGLLP